MSARKLAAGMLAAATALILPGAIQATEAGPGKHVAAEAIRLERARKASRETTVGVINRDAENLVVRSHGGSGRSVSAHSHGRSSYAGRGGYGGRGAYARSSYGGRGYYARSGYSGRGYYGRGGYGGRGYYGGRGWYGGSYWPYALSYYRPWRSWYYPYYDSYYYPSYYYSDTTPYYFDDTYRSVYPLSRSSSSVVLPYVPSSETVVPSTEVLPAPDRTEELPSPERIDSTQTRYRYDGGPVAAVPLPSETSQPAVRPSGTAVSTAVFVAQPVRKSKLTYAAYGEGLKPKPAKTLLTKKP